MYNVSTQSYQMTFNVFQSLLRISYDIQRKGLWGLGTKYDLEQKFKLEFSNFKQNYLSRDDTLYISKINTNRK